jgi:hypothetical protein
MLRISGLEGRPPVSDLIQLGIGERPWLPTPNTTPVEVFDRYDMPISGLIKQHGALFVFDCLEGHVSEGNVWIYAHVSTAEAVLLQRAEGDDFVRQLEVAFTDRPIMAAFAANARIRSGAQVDARSIKKVGLMQAVLDELKKGLDAAGVTKEALAELVDCS